MRLLGLTLTATSKPPEASSPRKTCVKLKLSVAMTTRLNTTRPNIASVIPVRNFAASG